MYEDQHDDECAEQIATSGACRHGHAFPTPEDGCGRQGCSHDDRGITVAQADGMLAAIKASHTCGEACTAFVMIAGGTIGRQLTCPWERLDTSTPADRKVIGTVYSSEARAAMGVLS